MNNTASAQRLRVSLTDAMGGDTGLLEVAGTTAVADGARVGSRRIACYQLGRHTMLFCDPDVVGRAMPFEHSTARSDPAFRQWAAQSGAVVIGQSVMKVARPSGLMSVSTEQPARRLRWSDHEDVVLMQAFVDASDPDDLDEAEVAMDELDDLAVAVLGPDGGIGAFASARPFEQDHWFGDIGIVSAPNVRRRGLGAAAVSLLVSDVLLPAGVEPLYRCDPENTGSDRLSASLGFEPALSLTVVELAGR